jgi:hypothetical protein
VRRHLRTYLTGSLKIVERSALFSAGVDWAEVRREADAVLEDARQYADTHDFLEEILVRAGGRHSGLIRPYRRRQFSPEEQEVLGPPTPTGRIIESAAGPVAYLRVPRTERADRDTADYIPAGETVLKALIEVRPRAWIVDLRADIGGNMWPMLAVTSPLLPDGALGFFEDRDGRYRAFGVAASSALLGKNRMARLSAEFSKHDRTPTAVLVSRYTASAGEAVALAFRARPSTCLIGAPTRGLTTANTSHPLRDKTIMRITKSYFADHHRNRLDGPVPVDRDLTGHDRAAVLDAALSWIAEA